MRIYPEHLPFWLEQGDDFPPTHYALDEPNGLLAVTDHINADWMLAAYSNGIFPWSDEGDQVTWWTPSPRAVLFTDQVKFRRSLVKVWRSGKFQLSFDQAFAQVVTHCADIPRPGQDGTWIRQDYRDALMQLHQQGHAHSVEVWQDQQLVGGLYGLSIGKMFFGESMFSHKRDASKLALVGLCKHLAHWGWPLIDCQMETDHLTSMGATTLKRDDFETQLRQHTQTPISPKNWQFNPDYLNA